jgi:hypothetical protein
MTHRKTELRSDDGQSLPSPTYLSSELRTDKNLAILKRLTARLTLLADTARFQEEYEMEATLIQTAAEVLTSSREIAVSSYAAKFIARLVKTMRKIEQGLGGQGPYTEQNSIGRADIDGFPYSVSPFIQLAETSSAA